MVEAHFSAYFLGPINDLNAPTCAWPNEVPLKALLPDTSIDWDYGVNVTIDHRDPMSRTATPTIVSLYKMFHPTSYRQTHLLSFLFQVRPDVRIQIEAPEAKSIFTLFIF